MKLLNACVLCWYNRSLFNKYYCSVTTLQIKGRWESNINVWFLFMYSQKWSCYFQNRIIMFCLPIPYTHIIESYICERFIYFQDRSAFSAAGKYVDRSREYKNRSQTHECGNWDWGQAIHRKGIHKWDFPCSVETKCKKKKLWTQWNVLYVFLRKISHKVMIFAL